MLDNTGGGPYSALNPLAQKQDNIVFVGIADIKIGKSPQIIRTTLGSCIAVCLYCQELQAGGMLHLMMAAPHPKEQMKGFKRAKYAQTGIPDLIGQLKTHYRIEPAQLTAKLFGGANLLPSVKSNIGLENEAASRSILKSYGIRVIAARTGGERGCKVDMDLSTGKVRCQVFNEDAREY